MDHQMNSLLSLALLNHVHSVKDHKYVANDRHNIY